MRPQRVLQSNGAGTRTSFARPLVVAAAPASHADLPAPRVDYVEVAAALHAQTVYPQPGARWQRWLDAKVLRGGAWRYAWQLRRAAPDALLTLSETTGLPLALLARREVPHVMIAHNLTTPRRRAFQRKTRVLQRIARIIVVSRAQEHYLRDEVGLPAERVVFLHDKVDHAFFKPQDVPSGGYILSVGREQRDYRTLIEAVRGTRLRLVIIPSSLWMPSHEIADGALPPNVEIRQQLPFVELRALYAAAAAVAVPIRSGVDYAAGVNAVLEGMAMAKPVIVSASPGLTGYLDERCVRVVPAGDHVALRASLLQLTEASDDARALGQHARAVIEGRLNLDGYVNGVVKVVQSVMH
jgi:glycosyltransferase involved in cell wall biosynthesis